MTVCVAAVTLYKEIVTVSDTMLTHQLGSADMCTVKMEPFANDWSRAVSRTTVGTVSNERVAGEIYAPPQFVDM